MSTQRGRIIYAVRSSSTSSVFLFFSFFFLRSEEEFEEFFGVSLGVGGEYVGHLGGRDWRMMRN